MSNLFIPDGGRSCIAVNILQLKVTLKYVKPPIWRIIQVPDDISFYKLHRIIQEAFGWQDYHLFEFDCKGISIGKPDKEYGNDIKNATRIKVTNYLNEKDKLVYTYDFGDNWVHEIVIEKILQRVEGVKYPRCISGKRSCPPEDVGGVPGYEEFLDAIRDPDHPEHEEMIEWAGEDFDPERFDIDEVNKILEKLKNSM
jgi:hypothetical protein